MAEPNGFISPYINGRFFETKKAERTLQLHNPARPSDILAFAGWYKGMLDPIVEGSYQAQKKYPLLPLTERLNLMKKFIASLRDNAEEIKSNMMLELSRSRVAVDEEWNLCERLFHLLPSFCERALAPKRDDDASAWSYAPMGSVLISSNVSLPVYSLLSAALPSLVAGNVICLRPSSLCLLSASLIASSAHQCEYPEGVVQVVYGDFEVFRRLVLTHQFNVIYYTGGEESLEQLRRDTSAQQNVRLILCGAGKNAVYIDESAQIDKAIEHSIYGMCVDTGQRLESTGLAFVKRSIFSEFQEKIVKAIKVTPVGVREDLNRSDIHVMGPLCSNVAWERFLRFQGIAARESDETLRWGKPIDNLGSGYFVSPGVHLIKDAQKVIKSIYASNSFLGPDICCIPVDGYEEVLPVLDKLESSRCLGIHTQYSTLVNEVRRLSRIPALLWNESTTTINPTLPTIGRGGAGNSYTTGLRFLLATVYPQSLNLSLAEGVTEGDFKMSRSAH